MPKRAPTPCTKPGCSSYSTTLGRCAEHQTNKARPNVVVHETKRPAWETTTTSSTSRGYGATWRKIRIAALRRDNYLCVSCKEKNQLFPAMEVDHIKPKADGGDDTLANLQSLCRPCHMKKTATEAWNVGKNKKEGGGSKVKTI